MRVPTLSLVALALLAFSLCGCNIVMTRTPLFTAADDVHVKFRDGVWLMDRPDCRVNEKASTATWPDCAAWGVRRDGAVFSFDRKTRVWKPEMSDADALVAAGDPLILQGRIHQTDSPETLYFYAGLNIKAKDPQGRITAYDLWLVQCGPPPPQTPNAPHRSRTEHPFAGLVMDPDDGSNCTTADPAALRAAARASKAFAESGGGGHWVRDGWS